MLPSGEYSFPKKEQSQGQDSKIHSNIRIIAQYFTLHKANNIEIMTIFVRVTLY